MMNAIFSVGVHWRCYENWGFSPLGLVLRPHERIMKEIAYLELLGTRLGKFAKRMLYHDAKKTFDPNSASHNLTTSTDTNDTGIAFEIV